jgi:hypothetical protein
MADKPVLPPAAYSQPHLRIELFVERQDYTPPPRAVTAKASGKERFSHGTKLSAELAQAFAAAQRMLQQRDGAAAEGDTGVYVEIVSDADKLLPESAWQQKGIRIAAVRTDDTGTQVGGLFVPQDAEQFLQDKLAEYTAGRGTDAAKKRFEKIDRVAPGTLATLWVDRRPLPEPSQSIWWECWCWKDRHGHLAGPAERLGLRVSEQRLIFPDCVVIPVYGTREEIERLLLHTDAVEKLRHASDTPHVFLHEMAAEQVPLVRDLAARVTPAPVSAPAACILDSGTNRGHPLLSGSLAKDDQHAVDANWSVDDHYRNSHGPTASVPPGARTSMRTSARLWQPANSTAGAPSTQSAKLLTPVPLPPRDQAAWGEQLQQIFTFSIRDSGYSVYRQTRSVRGAITRQSNLPYRNVSALA